MTLEALTHIPPKRLAIIIGVGAVGGLAWRHFHKSTSATTGGDATVDTSQLALAQNSAGNLGLAQTEPVPSTNDATRDFGSTFPLPVTKGVLHGADGIDYFIDPTGHILGPVNPSSQPAPTGGGTAVVAPPTATAIQQAQAAKTAALAEIAAARTAAARATGQAHLAAAEAILYAQPR